MKNIKLIIIAVILLTYSAGHAYVIQGSATVPVMNGNIVNADADAREKAILAALNNYFDILKSNEPDKEIPDVTTEFFKFIKSYKIADRGYADDMVSYTILADVDDVALNDLMYFVKNIVNTTVYNITGIDPDTAVDTDIASSFHEYKFDTRHQSDFQASLRENSTEDERLNTFKEGQAQYFMEMSVVREPDQENECSLVLTTKTFSKTKEFKTLKTKSSASSENEEECVQQALTLSLIKTLGFVRENFIPLPASEQVIKTFGITAVNYGNFAVPKKLMEELLTRSFIDSYKIKSFAGNTLEIDIKTYVDIDVLLKKLQSIESTYGFSAAKSSMENISLDFTQ